jgi:hypothetical protein
MAQPALEKFSRRGLLLAAANTTLLPGTHGLQLIDGSAGREFDKGERNIDRPHLGSKPFFKKNKRAFIQGTLEIIPPVKPGNVTLGVATVAPALLSTAMAQVLSVSTGITRYNPISTSMPLVDGKWYQSGTLLDVTDGRGNLSAIKCEIGEPITAQYRMQGDYTEVEEEALPSIDFSAFLAPTVATHNNSELVIETINGLEVDLHLWGKMLSIDQGNTIATKEYTEHKETGISERNSTFTARFARPAKDDFDVQAVSDAHQIIEGYWKLKEADGRYTKIAFRGQIENVNDTDLDGDFGYEITGPCVPSDSGNDEWSIEFGSDEFSLYFDFDQDKPEDVAAVYVQPVLRGEYVGPVTWSISAGALPAGLSINASTGEITGTPTDAGDSTFTISAVDSTVGTPLTATIAGTLTITA